MLSIAIKNLAILVLDNEYNQNDGKYKTMRKEFSVPKHITKEDLKDFRKKLGITQAELADLLGVSKPTIERWETSENVITGPIVLALHLINNSQNVADQLIVPSRTTKLRLKYMYQDTLCTVIDVDEMNQAVRIINYQKHLMFRAFGINEKPTFQDYQEFIESRCFPRSRDKMKIILKDLDITFYDPLLIIEKTKGRMAEDDFWIEVER